MKRKKFLLLFLFPLFAVTLYAQQAAAQEIPLLEDSVSRNETPEEPVEETEGGLTSEEAAAAEGGMPESESGLPAEEIAEETEGNLPESESEGELPSEEAAEPVPLSPEMQRVELEIKTSSLPELAAWSRTLGLSEGGTRTDLAKRLRDHFSLPEPGEPDENQKVITIESAQTTEYFTIDVIDEDYARLRGGVILSLRDKDSVHKISAGEVLFNRTRNILAASGGVEYIKEKDDTTEIFRGENITVNIDDWSSIFLEGESERKLSGEDTAYRFEGTVITRSDDDVMILKDSKVSKANNEDALWSISASKLWLLPGSDFAIFNGVLKVGEIPVLYIPFFYYPADEVIFHPVIGYRSREGGFVQTTTYILGRPKVDEKDKNSLTRILGNSNDMEKERHGLFLKSTGRKLRDPNAASLKFLLDYYNNLGFFLGLDLATPKKGILNSLTLSLGLGFTRTITEIDGSHTPYAPNFDGTLDWNHSNLFSKTVPFRYRLETSSSINGKYGSFSWNIPFYSDPFVDIDFLDRSENMDWVNMIQQGAAMDETEIAKQERENYQWQLNGSINPSVSALSPVISSISLSPLSMTLNFKKLEDKNKLGTEDPGRYFFVPDKYTIYSFSGSVKGTPLKVGGVKTASSSTTSGAASSGTNTETPQEVTDPLQGLGTLRPPWATEESTEEETAAADEKLVPPVLNVNFDLPKLGAAEFFVDYGLSPTGSSELQFMSGYDRWQTAEDVNWSEVQSILTSFGGRAELNFNLNHSGGLFSNKVNFLGTGAWQDFTFLNEEADAFRNPQNPEGTPDKEEIKKARRQQYGKTNYATSYSYIGTVRPLYDNPVFGQTDFQYTFNGTLVRSKKYEDKDEPELTPQWGVWEKDDNLGLTQHKFSTTLAANIMDKQQKITVSTTLPPLDPFISTSANFKVWISDTQASINFKKNNESNNEWKIEPFSLTETLTFASFSKATFFMLLEPESDNEITRIRATLSLWDLQMEFTAEKSPMYEFVLNELGGKWQETSDEPSLNPKNLTFNYADTFAEKELIKNRLTFSMNVKTSLSFDLQQHTASFFSFRTDFSLGINNFLKLTLSAESQNKAIFRYFKNIPGMEDLTSMYDDGPQNNVFTDLLDSFNFSDNSKRERSGFKMKSFHLRLDHYLGDWTASLDVTVLPEFKNTEYRVNTVVNLLVLWSSINEIKTDIKYKSETEKWTRE